ncbi:MAG: glutaredoxin [Leptotrichiaceae bacterium]
MKLRIQNIATIIAVLFTFIFVNVESFSATKVKIEYFGRADCKNCINLKKYLGELEQKRTDFEVLEYKIDKDPSSKKKFDEVTTKLKLVKGTPIIYIDDTIIQGFNSADTTGKEIEKLIDVAKAKDKVNTLDEYVANGDYSKISSNGSVCTGTSKCSISGETPQKELIVNIPFINKTVDLSKYSLPLVSFILGSIDGVNPCAMWVLVLFLTALIAVGDRRKMVQVAGLFILAEAVMYYMILNVWLYTWDFVGLDKIITPIVGIVGIIGGIFFIRNFLVKGDELSCEVTDFDKKAKISTKIQDVARKPFSIITALAIIGLALSVNVIEFACSIGIPQTFTKILQMNDLSFITRQFYNFLYIIGYMIDHFLVFGLALFSVNKLHLTSKYAKWANLFGGILMVLLGLMLMFKPTWLIF